MYIIKYFKPQIIENVYDQYFNRSIIDNVKNHTSSHTLPIVLKNPILQTTHCPTCIRSILPTKCFLMIKWTKFLEAKISLCSDIRVSEKTPQSKIECDNGGLVPRRGSGKLVSSNLITTHSGTGEKKNITQMLRE